MNLSLASISATFGTNEESLRLLLSLLLTYAINIIYSTKLVKSSVSIKYWYYLSLGVWLVYFNYGIDVYHSMITCLFCYAILLFVKNYYAVIINTIFTFTYLLIGCHVKQLGSNYSICWTLTQCVLTLRLIAISYDVCDGRRITRLKKNDERTGDKKLDNEDTAITEFPSVVVFLSHCYFPATILTGPLIPFKHYINYINSDTNHLNKCWRLSLMRFSAGMAYLAVFQIGSIYWPPEYLTSPQFSSYSLLHKLTAIAIIIKISMSKYLMSWLIAEGSCIASGVSWDGNDYYLCANIYITKYEMTPTFGGIIKSFNLTTNTFAAKYVFKRLKFLGNRTVSQFLTLIYLGIWHGVESGYLVTFTLEFLVMYLETGVLQRVDKLRKKSALLDNILNLKVVEWLIWLIFRVYTIYLLGYCMVPFVYLKFDLWYPIYKEVYFYGHIITVSWVFISFFI